MHAPRLILVHVRADVAVPAGDHLVLRALPMAQRMTGNVGVNWLLGLFSVVPVVGAVPTLLFRSNSRNLKIIKRHLDKHHAATATIEGQVTERQ